MDRHFLWWFRLRAGSLDHLRSTTQFGGPCGVSRQPFWVMFDDQVDYLFFPGEPQRLGGCFYIIKINQSLFIIYLHKIT